MTVTKDQMAVIMPEAAKTGRLDVWYKPLTQEMADHAINTSKMEHLVAADRAWNGALLTAPSLGERLHVQGKTLATVSTASTGSRRAATTTW